MRIACVPPVAGGHGRYADVRFDNFLVSYGGNDNMILRTTTVGLHKQGIKSPTYTLPSHCFAMMGAFPFIALGSIFWPLFWFERRLPEEVRQKRRREERQRNKGKRK